MDYVLRLKEVPRTGWNKKFPKGGLYKSRSVKNAESVADHSYSTAMLVLFLGTHLKLDCAKAVEMALIHDLMEAVTGDMATLSLPPSKRTKAIEAKRVEELAVIKDLAALGGYGKRIATLWRELDVSQSREAKMVLQLDKLEMDFQAVWYAQQGHKLDAAEFIESTKGIVQHPKLKALVRRLEALKF